MSAPTVSQPPPQPQSHSQPPSQSKTQISVRPATPADAASIASLGASTFHSCFAYSMPEDDVNTYLSTTYSTAAILAELHDTAKNTFFVAHTQGAPDQIVGFVQMRRDTSEPCLPANVPLVELHRIYVSNTSFGGGAGGKLMLRGLEWAKEQSVDGDRARGVWLGVWEENLKAQRFYARHGFEKVGVHGFTMGATTQHDHIVLKMF